MARIRFSDNFPLIIAFFIALLFTLTVPILFPKWRLNFFAPVLILSIYKKNFITSLILSACTGLLIDLLSSYPLFGIHAFCYCITTLLLYPQRRNFFSDSQTTLPLLTFIFSFLLTWLLVLSLFLVDAPMHLSFAWIETDLILFPIADALYAYLCFTLIPFLPRQKRREYFLNR